MRIIELLFDVLAPNECIACGLEGSLLCKKCAQALKPVPARCYKCKRWSDNFATCTDCRRTSPLNCLWTTTIYTGVTKDLLHQFKFERARAAGKPIVQLLAERYGGTGVDAVVPVPTANVRVRARGYDQAALLARGLAKQLGLPYLPALRRVGSKRQVGQKRQARLEQMDDAFYVVDNSKIKGKSILLVDDVLTTGATCEAAARILKQNGAVKVSASVFAVAE